MVLADTETTKLVTAAPICLRPRPLVRLLDRSRLVLGRFVVLVMKTLENPKTMMKKIMTENALALLARALY